MNDYIKFSDNKNESLTDRLFGIFYKNSLKKHYLSKRDINIATEKEFINAWRKSQKKK